MAAARIPAPRTPLEGRSPESAPRRGRRQDLAVPLGSLTQRDHRDGGRCRVCDSDHVTRLRMTLTDGTPVDFTSCHRCEHRAWEHAGQGMDVDTVLERSRKR